MEPIRSLEKARKNMHVRKDVYESVTNPNWGVTSVSELGGTPVNKGEDWGLGRDAYHGEKT